MRAVLQFYESGRHVMLTLNRFHRRRIDDGLWNPNARSAFSLSGCNLKAMGAMRNFSPGIWTCAALYAAIGLIGIFFLASGPGATTSSEGYGIAAIAAPAALH